MERNAKIIVNWDTLGQALGPDSTDADEEKFVQDAKTFAQRHGYGFETIRDIQKPGFIVEVDGECDDDTAETLFLRILP